MANLRINNLTAAPVNIPDVGIIIPASASEVIDNPALLRDLSVSRDLRALVTALTLSIDDTVNPLTFDDLAAYWSLGGEVIASKGSIPVATATGMNALPPTANGEVLTVDLTLPEGLKYVPPSSLLDPRDIFRFSMIHNVLSGGN
jgi:hypothetical protein